VPFSSDSKHFFALDKGKCQLEKNHLAIHFWGKNRFLLNLVKIRVVYVKKFLTKVDI